LGAYPRDGKLEPQDLTATMVHLLGIGHHATFPDALGRPMHVTTGQPIAALLGEQPATRQRVRPGGNLALVPGFSKDELLNLHFGEDGRLPARGRARRLKGWRASGGTLAVAIVAGAAALPRSGTRHAAIGFGLTGPCRAGTIGQGARAVLTQP